MGSNQAKWGKAVQICKLLRARCLLRTWLFLCNISKFPHYIQLYRTGNNKHQWNQTEKYSFRLTADRWATILCRWMGLLNCSPGRGERGSNTSSCYNLRSPEHLADTVLQFNKQWLGMAERQPEAQPLNERNQYMFYNFQGSRDIRSQAEKKQTPLTFLKHLHLHPQGAYQAKELGTECMLKGHLLCPN